MKKVMLVFGTRPEAIKMCPLALELTKSETLKPIVCVTGQHKEMLQQVLDVFQVKPDYDLAIMKARQTIPSITANVLLKLEEVLKIEQPDIVLVHGDTTTSMAAGLASGPGLIVKSILNIAVYFVVAGVLEKAHVRRLLTAQ